MPHTLKNVWPQVTCFENLVGAFYDAQRRKRFQAAPLRFLRHLEENLLELQGQLLHHAWRPGPYRAFWVMEPKRRLVQAPAFPDRVVHHALVRVVLPAFERRFIRDSYACRVGKGQLEAGIRLTDFLVRASHEHRHQAGLYVLKADISKYFPHIHHETLLRILARTVKDRDVAWLMRQLVTDCGYETMGLPIGALTSQLFANAYLDVMDHFIKDDLGVRYFVRYMDDFVIVHHNRRELHGIRDAVGEMLANRLGLFYNPKTSIFPTSHGIDFAGYRHWPTFRLPRKRNVLNARRRIRFCQKQYARGIMGFDDVDARIQSFLGYMKHCKSGQTVAGILEETVFKRTANGECEEVLDAHICDD